MENKDKIEVPFGAKDSELCECEYTIPEGYEAEIKDGEVIIRKVKSEDERIRKAILDVILSLPISPERTEMFYWLDKQADQKPVEWSDEDEEIYRNILNHYSLIEEPTDINGVPKERYINFIKSLRPQNLSNVERNGKNWKPSDEQMKALNLLLLKGEITEIGQAPCLQSLYNDLKAL